LTIVLSYIIYDVKFNDVSLQNYTSLDWFNGEE